MCKQLTTMKVDSAVLWQRDKNGRGRRTVINSDWEDQGKLLDLDVI